MTDLRKAAEMTLDALRLYVTMYPQMDKGYMVDAREALRQALAQPEQGEVVVVKNLQGQIVAVTRQDGDGRILKTIATSAQPEQTPVAWMDNDGNVCDWECPGFPIPLYTAPPKREWVGLTDDDRIEIFNSMDGGIYGFLKTWGWLNFSKALEAKLKDKNT